MGKLDKLEKGQGLVEYAFLLALIAIVVFIALLIMGPAMGNIFSSLNTSLTSV